MQLNRSELIDEYAGQIDPALDIIQMLLDIAESFSSEEEVIQAIADYQNGRLDISEYID